MPINDQIPAFVITLEFNAHRGRHAQQLLLKQGIQAELWMGVDGTRTIQFADGESVDNETFAIQFLRDPLSTEIGCFLAHYRLMRHVLQQGWQRILVFEDDAFPLPNLQHVLPQVLALDDSFEYINLQPSLLPLPLTNNQPQMRQSLEREHYLVRTLKYRLGTRAYAVNRPGIEKMLPAMMPITAPIDEDIDRLIWVHGLRAFDVWPGLLFHDGARVNVIGNRHMNIFDLRRRIRFFIRAMKNGYRGKHHIYRAECKALLEDYKDACLQEYGTAGGGSGIRTREGA